MRHLVALSGGKDSTALALRLHELEPATEFVYACTPTGDELPEMIGHWLRLEELLGTKLTYLTSGHSLGSLIDKWNALPNWRQRWCTRALKIEPFEDWTFMRRCEVGGAVMFWELKKEKGQPTKAQDECLRLMKAAGLNAGIRRPSDLLSGRMARELAALAGLRTAGGVR